jgi:hypothetical protein
MEQFVGTVEASAEVRTFNDVNSQELTMDAAVYVRPTAVKSDYLDAAVKEIPPA